MAIPANTPSPPDTVERRHLRAAGIIGIFPLAGVVIVLALGRFPYPDNNRPGHEYLDYVLPRHAAETQGIVWSAMVVTMLAFIALLAVAYMRRAGRITATAMSMIASMAVFAATSIVNLGMYMGLVITGHGYAGFGVSATDQTMVTFAWNTVNAVYAIGAVLAAMTWAAIAVANHRHAVLPPALGTRGAAVVSACNAATVGLLYVSTGPWSPGSVLWFGLQGLPTFGWTLIAAVFLLRTTRRA
ncbi:hypothetical protein ACFQ61_09750 [Streptomyces sp. NPDC056500]|uniref:hypothetical protein n=1 Tax=Streptomyces sp. NPDC056500 TaxID=3345840 RepID=UPI00368E0E77